MSPLYRICLTKNQSSQWEYLDQLIYQRRAYCLVMNLQGLIEGLLCEETDQQLQIKSLTNQLECSQKMNNSLREMTN